MKGMNVFMNLTVKNLSKKYVKKRREVLILDNFNYEFHCGNLYVIKADSGKGKTTLLTLLALMQSEDSGEIYFDHKLVSNLGNEEKCKLRRDHIGIVFQDYNLLNGLSVLDNITCIDICEKKQNKEELNERAMKLLQMLNLQHRVNHYPFELSGGEQQRVGIARAIIKNPSILICDEPVSNLDKENSKNIVKFISDYCHNENKLVIVTSHNEYFDEVADKVINF